MGVLAAARKPPRPVIGEVRSDGRRIGVSTIFHPSIVQLAKDAQGSWSQAHRCWVFGEADAARRFVGTLNTVPFQAAREVLDAADAYARIDIAFEAPDPDLFAPGLDVTLFRVAGGAGVVLRSKYDLLVTHSCRALGGALLRGRDGWLLPVPLERVLADLESRAGVCRGHLYVHDGEVVLDEHGAGGGQDANRPGMDLGAGAERVAGAAANDDDASAGVSMGVDVAVLEHVGLPADLDTLLAGYGLLDHQPDGVKHLLSSTSALLADDMGLGKSRQAAVACDLLPPPGCVVLVCPASLRIKWQREIHAVNASASAVILDRTVSEEPDWLIVSYERLGDVVQLISDGVITPKAMLVDEAHLLKEPSSARTLNAFLMAQRIPRRYLLTATPVLNREVEVHSLLRLSGHPIGQLSPVEFREQYAGTQDARRALRKALASWMLRRPKSVLKLAGKDHEAVPLQLEGDRLADYRRILNDAALTPLAKVGKLRQFLERAKSDWLIDVATGMGPDDKLVIMCNYTETVDYLADEFRKAGLSPVIYTGRESLKRRQAANDAFQNDPAVRVFIGTVGAAGVGIDLTAANLVAFGSLPWTAAMKRQAEDRAYRHGQLRLVTVLIPQHVGTIDERVAALVNYKEGIESDLLDEDVTLNEATVEAEEAAAEVAMAPLLLAA